MDALERAIQIGNSKETNYEPDQAIDPANINLRKDCEGSKPPVGVSDNVL
jgi:hypothetical protein